MTLTNKSQVNFVGGEVSPKVAGRTDLPLYVKGLERMENHIPEPQGPSRFRNGTVYVNHTRLGQYGALLPFQFNDKQAYEIEATNQYFRFYKDGGAILENTTAITAITNANPGVIHSVGHGYNSGDEVQIAGVVGLTGLNGKFGLVVKIDADNYSLTDIFGNPYDTSLMGAYSSGGTAARIYEVKTPYLAADLKNLQYTESADVMYIVCGNYEPRKLTRLTEISWTLARFSRTADPFITAKAITGISQANPGVVTSVGHHMITGSQVFIDGAAGMVEVNNRWFTATKIDANNYSIGIDTSGYGAWTSGGYGELYGALDASNSNSGKYPIACTFTDDSRMCYGGTFQKPATLNYSQAPDTNGALRYDDFTAGANPTNAVSFTLSSIHGKVDFIRWLANTDLFMVCGTFGTVRRIFGAAQDQPVTPTAINAKSVNNYGAQVALPVINGQTLLYIQRGGQFIQSVVYDYLVNGYNTTNINLVADHLTEPGLTQLVLQLGRPDLIWALRDDGVLLSLTYDQKENIAGWARQTIAKAEVQSTGVLPRESNIDQLWMIPQRYINGHTVNYVEYIADPPTWPDMNDFFTVDTRQVDDANRYLNALFEAQKLANHLDSSIMYDGSSYGTNANATLTVGDGAETAGSISITFTAGAAVFDSSMVGRQLWGRYDSQGIGGGRATITGFTSSTVVTCSIISAFPADTIFNAGDWFLTATTMSGLDHLESETVGVVADGVVQTDAVVYNGQITLSTPASVVIAGLRYLGMLKSLPTDQGGVSGSASDKVKNLAKVALQFSNSAGVWFGTSLYNLDEMNFLNTGDISDRPTPLFTGSIEQVFEDDWAINKQWAIVNRDPLPCTILAMDVYVDTTDEQ